jgi:hypothetical protein
MKKQIYVEGPKAKQNFENAMTALFKVKKTERAETIKKKPKKGKD